jgi:hypothetical protein
LPASAAVWNLVVTIRVRQEEMLQNPGFTSSAGMIIIAVHQSDNLDGKQGSGKMSHVHQLRAPNLADNNN